MTRDGWVDDAGKGERAGARRRRVTRLFALSKKGKRELDACSTFFLQLVRPDLAWRVLETRTGEGR